MNTWYSRFIFFSKTTNLLGFSLAIMVGWPAILNAKPEEKTYPTAFTWKAEANADYYILDVDDNDFFDYPLINRTWVTKESGTRLVLQLPKGTYYARVRGVRKIVLNEKEGLTTTWEGPWSETQKIIVEDKLNVKLIKATTDVKLLVNHRFYLGLAYYFLDRKDIADKHFQMVYQLNPNFLPQCLGGGKLVYKFKTAKETRYIPLCHPYNYQLDRSFKKMKLRYKERIRSALSLGYENKAWHLIYRLISIDPLDNFVLKLMDQNPNFWESLNKQPKYLTRIY